MALIQIFLLALFAQAAAGTAPATIRGAVAVSGDSSMMVAGAQIEVRRVDQTPPQSYTATTSADGTFIVANIRAGQYTMAVRKRGYLPAEFGQRRFNQSGTTLSLAAGQQVQGLVVAMTPAGAISGRVYDQDGEPVGAAEIFASTPSFQNGMRSLGAVQSTVTDDLGRFRLFDLPPADYYISAAPPTSATMIVGLVANPANLPMSRIVTSIPMAAASAGRSNLNLPIYFPGTADVRLSTPIQLRPGQEFRGADFRVPPSIGVHVRGAARAGDGAVTLSLAPLNQQPGAQTYSVTVNPQTGRFDIAGVAPGDYMLIAKADGATGHQIIDVGESDLDVSVGLAGGFSVPGRVVIDDRAPTPNDPDMDNIHFDIALDPVIPDARVDTYGPVADGTFSFRQLIPGNYRVMNFALKGQAPRLQNAYVKSMRLANQDVLRDGLRVTGPVDGTLEIVIGTRPGTVTGTAVNGRGLPVGNATVVLGFDKSERRTSDLFFIAQTDAAGRFTIGRVPPGSFKLFAWQSVEPTAWQNPDFLIPYEDRGTPVQVSEGATVQNVTIVAFQ